MTSKSLRSASQAKLSPNPDPDILICGFVTVGALSECFVYIGFGSGRIWGDCLDESY